MLKAWGGEDFYAPLYASILAVIQQFTGPSRESASIANALLFLPAALAMTALARRLTGRALGGVLAVALCLALPVFAFYSRIAGDELPMGAVLAILVWGLLASNRLTKTLPLLVAAIALAAGLLMKWTFVIYAAGPLAYVAAHTLIAGFRRARTAGGPVVSRRQLLNAAAGILICVSLAGPWYVYGLSWKTLSANSGAYPTLDGGFFGQLFYFPAALLNTTLSPWPFLAAFILCLPFLFLGEKRSESAALAVTLAVSWLMLTLIPHKEARYNLTLIPLCALCIAVGLCRAAAMAGRAGKVAAVTVGLVLFVVGAAKTYDLSFRQSVIPTIAGQLEPVRRECLEDADRLWLKLEPVIGEIPKKEIALGLHPYLEYTRHFWTDVLQYYLEQRNARGAGHSFVIGYDVQQSTDFPRRYLESNIILVSENTWRMTREDVTRLIDRIIALRPPDFRPPTISAADPAFRGLVESAYRLADTVPLRCDAAVLIYVRK